MSLLSILVGLLATAIPRVHAQTWTDCQPLNETCPPNPAFGTNYTWNFSSDSLLDDNWNITNGAVDYAKDGMMFSIQRKLDSPTIRSKFYIFFGRVEYHIQAAPGAGVISSAVLQSDDLDEIDWEWIGADEYSVQSNYFGKGEFDSSDGKIHNVTENLTKDYHNYTTWWDKDKLEWWYDGQLLRTLKYEDADGGKYYPQTPMTIRLGIWPAGDPSQPKGRIEWAGGEIDYTDGPYTMYVKQVKAEDFSSGKEYVYTDHSGSWESIEIVPGNSTTWENLYGEDDSLSQKWARLPQAAKVGVYAGGATVAAICIAALVFFCIRQRRIGRREFNIQNNKMMEERTEMMNLQAEWRTKGYVGGRT
ncbi:hypothetical protein VTN31DRAFT_2350 [Thermomyces dupontii]|uniref:uncharacterized protein n=1 Tax=Talaromyces thermophilus TaxID=28565 RepID=UPI000392A9FF